MVFTQAQTTAFFESADQMAIPHDTIAHLVNEGIASVQDLAEIDKESIIAMAKEFRSNDITFGAKSQGHPEKTSRKLFFLTNSPPSARQNVPLRAN